MKEIAKLKAKEENRKLESKVMTIRLSEVDLSEISVELANIEGLFISILATENQKLSIDLFWIYFRLIYFLDLKFSPSLICTHHNCP